MQDYNNWKREHGRMMNTFTINNKTYNIELSKHAEERLQERKIDSFQMIGAILALGEQRILQYSNSKRDILIRDKENGFSVICCIEGNVIIIITLIDNADALAKHGTSVISL